MTEQSLSITARDLGALVRPVIPLAGKDDGLPILTCVHFEVHDGYLLAMTTDRFRIGIQRRKTDVKAFTANVKVRDLKTILSLFKPTRTDDPAIRLTVDDKNLRVETDGALPGGLFAEASLTFELDGSTWPDLTKLLAEAVNRKPEGAAQPFVANAHFLGDFRHAVDGSNALRVQIADPSKPILVNAGKDFLGMLMPLRAQSGCAADDLSWWASLVKPAEPEKPARKRAAKKASAA